MHEREVKLAAGPGFRLPDLADPGNGRVSESRPVERYRTTYFDTEDLRLARWGCSLRHRTGQGWTVKLPLPSEGSLLVRREQTFAGKEGKPPEEAVDLVLAYVRSASLVPVACLQAVRRGVNLRDSHGAPLAEVVDDEVTVMDGPRVAARFRELEIELAPQAEPEVAAEVAEALRRAGAGSPEGSSKYARAVGPRASDPPEVVVPDGAEEVVRATVASSVLRLLRHDPGVRVGDDPEDVHEARVATRRLRSDLATFAPLLDQEWVAATRDELKWLAASLGEVRDADVLLERFRVSSRQLPVLRATERLLERLEHARQEARTKLLSTLRELRYVELLDRLVTAAQIGPPAAAEDPGDVRPASLVEGPFHRLRRAVSAAEDPATDEQLHAIRIAAKRARYAAEAVAPLVGKSASNAAREAAKLQTVLGEHQDAVVANEWLRSAAVRSSPAQAFAAGQLAALEVQRAAEARAAWPKAWRRLRKEVRSSWA